LRQVEQVLGLRAQNQAASNGPIRVSLHGPSLVEIFARLAEIDRQMDAQFKEAVDLATQFNTEQAANVITNKIDPLLNKAVAELLAFIAIQKQHGDQATEQANTRTTPP
jgi:methyl-accepting chemotaxis protein